MREKVETLHLWVCRLPFAIAGEDNWQKLESCLACLNPTSKSSKPQHLISFYDEFCRQLYLGFRFSFVSTN